MAARVRSNIPRLFTNSARMESPAKNESAPDSLESGDALIEQSSPKTALNHLTFCSLQAQLTVVTRSCVCFYTHWIPFVRNS
jgi:hypothetical protein